MVSKNFKKISNNVNFHNQTNVKIAFYILYVKEEKEKK